MKIAVTKTALVILVSAAPMLADTGLAVETRTSQAVAKYGMTGKGVIVAILDRGIDYAHPDFRNADGTTRIKYLLDMSGQNLCDAGNPAPAEYSAADINNALTSGTPLNTRDAVGHGTVTTGLAAGNGRAFANGKYAGMAPQADLLIVKVTSEGAPQHGTQPAEAAFQGCYDQGLDWVIQKAASLGEPLVALIDSGTQWGPIDGTSAVSRKIDANFGASQPGRVYIAASGDEGTLANHARSAFTNVASTVFNINKSAADTSYMQAWYSGGLPANVTVTFADDGTIAGPAPPGGSASAGGVTVYQYNPGQQFYPWTSSGPARAVWIQIVGHTGAGTIQFQATQPGTGVADVYGDAAPIVTFTNLLTPGRLTDYSSTRSAIVTGCYNLRTSWVDINGQPQSITTENPAGYIWKFSSGGPARDGRVPPNGGVDLATPGGNAFAAYAQNSWWETFQFNLVQDGGGWYGRHSATSAAAPITVGAAALLLQMNPSLTADQIRTIIHNTSRSDVATGTTPNGLWGSGKLNMLAAADSVAGAIPANPSLSVTSLSFGSQAVGTTSAPKPVTLSNSGTAALGITRIASSGNFYIASNNCGNSLAAGGHCIVWLVFHPAAAGARTGTLTFRDFNTTSPQTVAMSGTGI